MADSFDEALCQAVHNAMLDFVRKGDWIAIDYGSRVKIQYSHLRDILDNINFANVVEIVRGKVETKIADNIFNSMATEIATDVKKIMANQELREDLRAIIRAKIREAQAAITKRGKT